MSPEIKVHIDRFVKSEVLVQKTEHFILEAPKIEKMETEEEKKPMMDILKGLQEAKIKAENFKKRQELKELEKMIEDNERKQKDNLEKGEREIKKEEKADPSDTPWRSERKKEQMRWVGEEEHRYHRCG